MSISELYSQKAKASSGLLHAQLTGDRDGLRKYGKQVRELRTAINELNGY